MASKYIAHRLAVAVDAVIFGFDGEKLRLLLIKRDFAPMKNRWSLVGGFVQENEGLEAAAVRILESLTGLKGIYMEQIQAFGEPKRDPMERTISVAYYALIDLSKYRGPLSEEHHAAWFNLDEKPKLIFDHDQMVDAALEKLQIKAELQPILFELLPEKFTIRQVFELYQAVHNKKLDLRNFIRKIMDSDLIVRTTEKARNTSKKGSFLFRLKKSRKKSRS